MTYKRVDLDLLKRNKSSEGGNNDLFGCLLSGIMWNQMTYAFMM